MRINKLEMEWTDDGCVAKAEGFSGVMLTCPRCQELLPRDEEHRCGDRLPPPLKKVPSKLKPKQRGRKKPE